MTISQDELDAQRALLVTAFHKTSDPSAQNLIKSQLKDLVRQEAMILMGQITTAALDLSDANDALEAVIKRISDPVLMLKFDRLRNIFRKEAKLPPAAPTSDITPNISLPGPAPIPTPTPSPSPTTPVPITPVPTTPIPVTPIPVTPIPAPVVVPIPSIPAVSPTKRSTDLSRLHPDVRKRVKAIEKQLADEKIPMRVFEAYREPERQAHLYAKGRTSSGNKVTNAEPWESYHQYGMAADFVRFENGKWNWNDKTTAQKRQWDRFHEIARENGLEPLSWERPHVQLIGTSFAQLMHGDYPSDGDDTWADALSAAINRWPAGTNPAKPPLPDNAERPASPIILGAKTPAASQGWHNKFGGDAWRYDQNGVYTRHPNGAEKLWRTSGSPITVHEILAHHMPAIRTASDRFSVPEALIVMTIATETGAFRNDGFTGPKTFRWEQGVKLAATGDASLDGKERGDYSAGPMQILSNTARWMNNVKSLGFDNKTTLKWFKNKPSPNPQSLGLYDSETNILLGTAYIAHNIPKTGLDPLLVAASYNAGSLRPSSSNHWRIHSHGNHIDRAAEWYGDACKVLNGI